MVIAVAGPLFSVLACPVDVEVVELVLFSSRIADVVVLLDDDSLVTDEAVDVALLLLADVSPVTGEAVDVVLLLLDDDSLVTGETVVIELSDKLLAIVVVVAVVVKVVTLKLVSLVAVVDVVDVDSLVVTLLGATVAVLVVVELSVLELAVVEFVSTIGVRGGVETVALVVEPVLVDVVEVVVVNKGGASAFKETLPQSIQRLLPQH